MQLLLLVVVAVVVVVVLVVVFEQSWNKERCCATVLFSSYLCAFVVSCTTARLIRQNWQLLLLSLTCQLHISWAMRDDCQLNLANARLWDYDRAKCVVSPAPELPGIWRRPYARWATTNENLSPAHLRDQIDHEHGPHLQYGCRKQPGKQGHGPATFAHRIFGKRCQSLRRRQKSQSTSVAVIVPC